MLHLGKESENLKDLLDTSRKVGKGFSQRYQLGLKQPKTSGVAGSWLGVGLGSSVDFQDHRSYSIGDDPRYINWQAYARSGEYTMKLYRDEVSPAVDIVFDCSGSMFEDREKLAVSLALFYFCIESSLELGASIRCFSLREGYITQLATESLHTGHWLEYPREVASQLVPQFDQIPWRAQSARVILSDLLFPGLPNELLGPFTKGASWTSIFSVYSENESNPSWKGGVNLIDSETNVSRVLYSDQLFLKRFKENYRKHFSLWGDFTQRSNIAYLRLCAEHSLEEQLQTTGLRSGVLTA